jgi:hypothetical protein
LRVSRPLLTSRTATTKARNPSSKLSRKEREPCYSASKLEKAMIRKRTESFNCMEFSIKVEKMDYNK